MHNPEQKIALHQEVWIRGNEVHPMRNRASTQPTRLYFGLAFLYSWTCWAPATPSHDKTTSNTSKPPKNPSLVSGIDHLTTATTPSSMTPGPGRPAPSG